MIVVLATIELNHGKRPDFLVEFQKIVPKVRAEAGCIEYFPAIDYATGMPVQGPAREDVVVVCEKWESVPALEAHLIAAHDGVPVKGQRFHQEGLAADSGARVIVAARRVVLP